ncbi:MAG: MBL fold metallo-hydrolase, partial [Fibrobacteres bacterium]|nr:MBL fold metallo-hydrolase [Fibrobacterota bacterium]
MNAKIIFFDVGHGDSMVIEVYAETTQYIVIDSQLKDDKTNPGVEYLKALGVKNIAALFVTHFHFDHINGMDDYFNTFEVEKLFIPPVLSSKDHLFREQVSNLKKKMLVSIKQTSSSHVIKNMSGLESIVRFICKNPDKIEELQGKDVSISIPSLPTLQGSAYLPLPRIKGEIRQTLIKGNYDFNRWSQLNDSSLALHFELGNKSVLLTGDSTLTQWYERKRQTDRDNRPHLDVQVLKVSHHGSKENNDEKLFSYLFSNNDKSKIGIVSANGISHPSPDVLSLVNKFGLRLFCTNLSNFCANGLLSNASNLESLPHCMQQSLSHYIDRKQTTCQGNIIVTLRAEDPICNVSTSNAFPCVYNTVPTQPTSV